MNFPGSFSPDSLQVQVVDSQFTFPAALLATCNVAVQRSTLMLSELATHVHERSAFIKSCAPVQVDAFEVFSKHWHNSKTVEFYTLFCI